MKPELANNRYRRCLARLVRVLPCPFCGKQPEVFPSGDRTDGAEMIECMTDGCVNPHVSYYGVNVARQKWNTRAVGISYGEGSDIPLSEIAGCLAVLKCPTCDEDFEAGNDGRCISCGGSSHPNDERIRVANNNEKS